MKLSEFKPTEEVLERVHKCTTSEEIEKLAQEYDVELTAEEISEILKYNSVMELNDEHLDHVAGGADGKEDPEKHLPSDHGPTIGKYEAQGHIGQKVYCVQNLDPKEFCWGILEKSYECDTGLLWRTTRVHNIRILGWCHDTDTLHGYRPDILKNMVPGWFHIPVGEVFNNIDGDRNTLFFYNK